ncbi:MAG TPA: hypothetical protein GX529_09385, partial [Firmicutes bacterium]|nr:hypothetical protein [Candidatus Fermentithermobacillaceae bacterium]
PLPPAVFGISFSLAAWWMPALKPPWLLVVKPGRILFEIAGVPEETAREALRLASTKLPMKTKFQTRPEAMGALQEKAVREDEGAGN